MLGLYDSGLGGLTVLAALRAAGIDQDVVYFADQAHVPYGDKTDAQLHGYLEENLALLGGLRVDAVVTACNTTCAVAERYGWPATPFPVLDLIATAGRSFAVTPHRRVAVVATVATVRSGAYARAIRAAAPHVEVVEIAAPALVPIVEHGEADQHRRARLRLHALPAARPLVRAGARTAHRTHRPRRRPSRRRAQAHSRVEARPRHVVNHVLHERQRRSIRNRHPQLDRRHHRPRLRASQPLGSSRKSTLSS
jgi:hypothetical protein